MYESGNGYLENWTNDQLLRLRKASKREAQLRTAKSSQRLATWPQNIMAGLGGRLVTIGQRLQEQSRRYQIATR